MNVNSLDDLDERQAAAARDPASSVVVRAGAGTGKTRTLVARVLHLVAERAVAPDAVTVVTFTNKAAREISARLESVLPARNVPFVGTFHRLAARILRRNADAVGLTRRFSVIGEDDRRTLARNVLRRSDADRDVDELMRRIDGWKASGLTAAHVLDPTRARRTAVEERDAGLFVDLEEEIRGRDMIDFGGLINECNRIFAERRDVGDEISAQVLHLLVDEAQDANPAQVSLARNLSRVHRNAFAVGDEDQSIYSFQGGRPSSLAIIAGDDPVVHSLVRNRRSTDPILRPAVALVSRNRNSRSKVLASGIAGVVPEVRDFPNEKAEASFVATEVRRLLREGASPEQVAVLVRSTHVVYPVEEAFVRLGLPYDVVGGVTLADREETKDLCAYVRLAMNPLDDLAFRRIAARPARGIGPSVEEAVYRLSRFANVSFAEACARIDEIEGTRVAGEVRQRLDAFGEILSWLDVGFSRQNWSSLDLVDYVLSDEGAGYRRWVADKDEHKARRKLDVIETLRSLALATDDPCEFLERVSLSGEADEPQAAGTVRIATMHSSKGLEWDHVFLPAFEAGVVPAPKSVKDARVPHGEDGPWSGSPVGGVEEERRLAHVAITRARRGLAFSYSRSRKGRPTVESPFLHESGLGVRQADAYGFDEYDPFASGKGDLGFGASPRRGARRG